MSRQTTLLGPLAALTSAARVFTSDSRPDDCDETGFPAEVKPPILKGKAKRPSGLS
jgi:hypothetical protein